jgi:hypothetical protein
MEDMRNINAVVFRNPYRKRSHREDNIEMNVREIACEPVE